MPRAFLCNLVIDEVSEESRACTSWCQPDLAAAERRCSSEINAATQPRVAGETLLARPWMASPKTHSVRGGTWEGRPSPLRFRGSIFDLKELFWDTRPVYIFLRNSARS